jgi:outer membrane protein assembly factor BamA
MRLLGLAILTAALAAAQPKFSIREIRVEGNSRFASSDLLRAAGLEPGQGITVEDLQSACTRLADTGLIQSARYRYKPAPGAARAADVTLVVEESQDLQPVRIQIPEVEEERVWAWLAQNDRLVRKEMPSNDQATAYYARAIERFLAAQGRSDQIVTRYSGGLAGGPLVAVFRPAVLPKIAAVRFEGAQLVPATALEKAIAQTALGQEYTEDSFRELLKYNVGRLYESRGHLRVRFPRIAAAKTAADDLALTVTVEEGPVYHIGAFEVAGQELPPLDLAALIDLKKGDTASWDKVLAVATRLSEALGRYGYLSASSDIERNIDDQNLRVDVTVVLEKHRQSKFGELRLEGLAASSQTRARLLWKLAPGAPVNTEYIEDYLRLLMRDGQITFKRVSRRYQSKPGADIVDVVVTFK